VVKLGQAPVDEAELERVIKGGEGRFVLRFFYYLPPFRKNSKAASALFAAYLTLGVVNHDVVGLHVTVNDAV
jgi:hypothetical protein